MADLRIDYQMLDQVSASLGTLSGELEHIQATQDGYNAAMGSNVITGAMNGFASNWSIHRKRITDSMRTLQQHAHETRQGFAAADHGLAHDLASKVR